MSSVPSVLTVSVLPPAEMAAARLDGELFAIDESWACADEPDRPELRAGALGALLPRSIAAGRLVAMGLTAAWVLGATDAAPWRHELCVRSEERARLWLPPRFVVRELIVDESEECRIAGLRVTTPVRTAFDLARRDRQDEAECAALRELVRRYRILPADLADGIRSRSGAGRARERVEEVWAQPPLTR